MKKRYIYALLFGVPGFFISVIISFFLFGAVMGVLWIFIFGDNPWPASVENSLGVVFVLAFLILWIGLIIAGYFIGKRLENDSTLNKSHILFSSGLTILFITLILFQQFSVGNLGPKSDSQVCMDFCISKGYSASGMPPQNSGDRTCSCYDSNGHEALKVPLDSISK
jgi:hypothetical protein